MIDKGVIALSIQVHVSGRHPLLFFHFLTYVSLLDMPLEVMSPFLLLLCLPIPRDQEKKCPVNGKIEIFGNGACSHELLSRLHSFRVFFFLKCHYHCVS